MSVEAANAADEVTMSCHALSTTAHPGTHVFSLVQRLALGAGAAVVAALLLMVFAVAAPTTAQAQDPGFIIELDNVEVDSGAGETVIAVRLLPGTEPVAALSLTISPDTSLVTATASTSVDTTFVCALANGSVRFAGFDQPGWGEPIVLCEITLVGTGTTGSGAIEVEIKTATNVGLEPLAGQVVGGTIQVGGAAPTPEPSSTPTPAAEPTPTATPTATPVPEVAVVPTPTPSATPTPTPSNENADDADATDTESGDTQSGDTDSGDTDSSDTGADGDDGSPNDAEPTVATDPNVELDPDGEDVNDSTNGSLDSDRGARSLDEPTTTTPAPVDDSVDGPDDTDNADDGAPADNDAPAADDSADESADDRASEEAGDIELSGPPIDGSTVATTNGEGSSQTAALAGAAIALLVIGSAVGVATRRADRRDGGA